MFRTMSLVLAVAGVFVVADAAQAVFIADSDTNGVVFSDNFEGQSLGYLGSASAPTGSWSAYAGADATNGNSTVNVVNASTGGFAANEGSQYLQMTRPGNGGSIAYAHGLEAASEDYDLITSTVAFRLNAGGHLCVYPMFQGSEIAGLYLKPDGSVNVIVPDQSIWTPLTQTLNVGEWNTLSISRTNGKYGEAYGGDYYSVSVNGQTPENMPIINPPDYLRTFSFTEFEFNCQGGTVSIDAVPIPEPSSVLLAVAGIIGLLAYAWKTRK